MLKENLKIIISELVNRFEQNINQYKSLNYDEANTRADFIDPFFEALGWDVYNKQGYAEQYREVVREDRIIIEGKAKAPDYSFRIGGIKKFFVEAKKPSVDIKKDIAAAFQLRRYAYTSKLPLSILTNFEEFAVYDTRIKPDKNDKPDVARIFYCTYKNYLEQFDFIYNSFSKDGILKGSFDRYVESTKNKKGTSEVDKEFLKLIDSWREILSKNIALRNKNLNIEELNYAVQKIIDRIIFLRIAEDRQIEKYGQLQELLNKDDIYKTLIELFYKSEEKYNSSLFDFKKDKITPSLIIDNKIFNSIIKSIYYPDSPYEFSVLNVEILGNIYEQFLGKNIRLTSSNQAKVEYKPEIKKTGGVYYTPKYIVDYIVHNTIGAIIKNKTLKQIEKIKILDPACGSGSFLLGAYDYLLNFYLKFYLANKNKAIKENKIYERGKDNYALTIEEKRKILLNNIFGVDIDLQAVEVTKLSLLLKLLEEETKESTLSLFKYLDIKILPDLSNNIKCGNSLIGTEIYGSENLNLFEENSFKHINPMDWDKAFPDVFKQNGFDVIIGNPPYIKEYTNIEPFEFLKKSRLKKYYEGKMDLWYAFACISIDLLKNSGYHSFIATNNWITSAGASIMRNKILSETKILKFIDFADFKVFENASIQTMIYVLKKEKTSRSYKMKYTRVLNKDMPVSELADRLNKDIGKVKELNIKDYEWFNAVINPEELKDKTFAFVREEIQQVLEKIKSKANYRLNEKDVAQGIIPPQDFVIEKHLKKLKDKSIKKGDGIFILTTEEIKKLNLLNEEKNIIKPYYTSAELEKYYGDRNNKLWIIYSDIVVWKNIKKYPNIKNHLDKFKTIITSDFKPYGLHRAREQHFFEGEKIISLRKTIAPIFTYTDFICYVSQTFFIIQPADIDLKYLTALLNSKITHFWLYFKGKKQGDQLQVDKEPLLNLPLVKLEDTSLEDQIVKMVDRIIEIYKRLQSSRLYNEKEHYKNEINSIENDLNKIFYKIYGLTSDETKIIERNI